MSGSSLSHLGNGTTSLEAGANGAAINGKQPSVFDELCDADRSAVTFLLAVNASQGLGVSVRTAPLVMRDAKPLQIASIHELEQQLGSMKDDRRGLILRELVSQSHEFVQGLMAGSGDGSSADKAM